VCPDPHYSQGLLIFPKFAVLEEEVHPAFRQPLLPVQSRKQRQPPTRSRNSSKIS
jgi:hypothetical protein